MDIRPHHIEQGKGFPLILLHGNGEDVSYFVHQMESLSKHFRVIAIDAEEDRRLRNAIPSRIHFAFCYFNMSGFNPLNNLLFNATSIAWPLMWGLVPLTVELTGEQINIVSGLEH